MKISDINFKKLSEIDNRSRVLTIEHTVNADKLCDAIKPESEEELLFCIEYAQQKYKTKHCIVSQGTVYEFAKNFHNFQKYLGISIGGTNSVDFESCYAYTYNKIVKKPFGKYKAITEILKNINKPVCFLTDYKLLNDIVKISEVLSFENTLDIPKFVQEFKPKSEIELFNLLQKIPNHYTAKKYIDFVKNLYNVQCEYFQKAGKDFKFAEADCKVVVYNILVRRSYQLYKNY
jgi:hypothetical protein